MLFIKIVGRFWYFFWRFPLLHCLLMVYVNYGPFHLHWLIRRHEVGTVLCWFHFKRYHAFIRTCWLPIWFIFNISAVSPFCVGGPRGLTSRRAMCMWFQPILNDSVFDVLASLHIDTAISWSTQIIFDVFIFLFTLTRSLRIRKEGGWNITDILLRDGMFVKVTLLLPLTPMNGQVYCTLRVLRTGLLEKVIC